MSKKDFTNREWWIDVAYRAVKTAAQTAASMIIVGQSISDINWITLASISAVAGIASVLTSIALPDKIGGDY